ncbi:CusA/CzcA family heavy metal efflux RND transporter [Ilyomonas limi]|uniref:CusA/CzcA family heavy metal efflux RND transporter n=1 Tax=Ilyomonas limi TaxID=2575867 RepID=A0A4U3LAZ5_9BACT|nr:CusA/CzcA family heavy metal efflux RND transporter [Ilyomonas limi]TKK71634.1 CusA/CzcA family heavy metal efflux RND transporter [Ilyomonas limi]
MLNRIIAFSIRNKLIVGMLILALIGWGIYNVTRLPIDAVPDITNNQVLVITSSPSLGAADIERLITFPIEIATRNIPGIIEQRSFSRFGLSIITIVFDDKTDVYWARQQVSERLTEAKSQIPEGLGTPTLGPVTTGLGEIFQYVVRPKRGYEGKYTPVELRTIQDWIVRRQLLGTPGVADVSSFGGKLKQYEIAVNTDKLKSYHLTISDLFNALQNNNQNTGGAYIEKGPTALFIRSEGLVQQEEDIKSIVVKTLPDGTPATINDIATVGIGFATRYGAMTYNDQGEVAGAIVMMLKGGNSSKVIKDVKAKIADISKTLPEGVIIEPFLDRTKMVNNAIGTVEKNLIEGALIVVFILVLFLGNIRAGLLVASIIPLSMLFAISMMNLFGVSGNLMSLGALDFGLIVDGAVIIVETVMHHLHQKSLFKNKLQLSQEEMNTEVEHAAGKLMNAAIFGQIIILIVYFPILSLQGIEGKMFKPMAQTVIFAIIGAFLLSLTYVPMMSSLVLSKKLITKQTFSDKMMKRFESWYRPVLQKALSFPGTVLLLAASLFSVALYIILNMGGEFIPKLEEGDFAVDTRVLTGSSITTTIQSTQQAARILLQQFPEVQKVVTKIGSGEIPTDPMPMEASDMMVVLNPKKEWTSAKSFDELAEKMSTSLEEVPGITTGFQFPVQMRFNELMTGGRQDVICKIFGENLDTLAHYAGRIGNIISKIEGAKDMYVESQTGLPQIEINYNRQALAQYGIAISDVNNIVQSAFAGAVAGQVYENERRFDLAVRLANAERQNLADVQNLLIPTSRGEQIPLQQIADVQIKVGPNQIQRENAQRRTTVGFNVRGKDVQTVVKELQEKMAAQLKLPPAYYVTYGGQFENLIEAKQRLSIAVPVSLALIFIMLYFAFHSLGESLLIFTAIPLSAIGGVFALFIRGMPFSISAGVGFIALFGIAVLNGIVLLSEFNQLEKNGIKDPLQRIKEGTRNRLRPVLMTASVASLGFLPMAISTGAGAEVQRPLATVVIGGLISATLLTLVVLPVLYGVFQNIKTKRKHKAVLSKNISTKAIVILFLLTGASSLAVRAQEHTISLQAAIDTALNQNLSIQAARLQTAVLKRTENTAWDLPFTTVQAEYGQMNSIANDTRINVSQSMAFPQVYNRQRALYEAHTKSGLLNEKVVRLNIKKEVTILYYDMATMLQKIKLLTKADSIYAAFLQRQQQRFNAGEVNVLEKTSAETQRMQALIQLQQAAADFRIVQNRFSYLLNSNTLWLPEESESITPLLSLPDTSFVSQYPAILRKQQQQHIALQEIKLNRAKKLPLLNAGYSNQSIIGYQHVNGTEKYFNASKRFSSVIAGIGIPIFSKSLNARIRGSEAQYRAVQAEYADTLALQKAALQQLILQYQKQEQTLNNYRQAVTKQVAVIYENATLQFVNGAISYLEWAMLINQAISLEASYIDALNERNKTVAELNSYSPDF